MSAWPSIKILGAALTGRAIRVINLAGLAVRAVPSSYPWIYYLPSRGAICMRCQAVAPNPTPPKDTPEMSPQKYATWLQAQLLHAFAKKHSKCKEPQSAE